MAKEIIVSEVTFFPLRPTDKGLIGFSSCTFDGKLSLNSIAVYLTTSGDIRLVFPDKVLPNTKKINIFFPINNVVYETIRQAIKQKVQTLFETVERNRLWKEMERN